MPKLQKKFYLSREIRLPMRDSVELTGVLYYSEKDSLKFGVTSKHPVIIGFSLWGGKEYAALFRYYSQYNFICIAINCRGREDSGGIFGLFQQDPKDAEDWINWISMQTWCDGNIGYYGHGYGGTLGWLVSLKKLKNLRTIILSSANFDFYRGGIYRNGVFEIQYLAFIIKLAASSPKAKANRFLQQQLIQMQDHIDVYAKYWPFVRGSTPLAILPEYEKALFKFGSPPFRKSFFEQRSLCSTDLLKNYPALPTLQFSGWNDDSLQATLKCFYEINFRQENPVQCFIGPWDHNGIPNKTLSFFNKCSYQEYTRRWFQHWLMSEKWDRCLHRGIYYRCQQLCRQSEDCPRTYLTRGFWQQTPYWPPSDKKLIFYLYSENSLLCSFPKNDDGKIFSTSYYCNLEHPVPTIGGSLGELPISSGILPQEFQENKNVSPKESPVLPLCLRNDVATFRSMPLKCDLIIAGTIQIKLYFSCLASDADICCKLCAEIPGTSGQERPISINIADDTVQRLSSYQKSPFANTSTPKFCRFIAFDIASTAMIIPSGYRLCLNISGSNFPRFALNHSSISPRVFEARDISRKNEITPISEFHSIFDFPFGNSYHTLYHGRSCPSCLILPILPFSQKDEKINNQNKIDPLN
ncbi:MAG: CocE/NonD family hydrolase [Lentisphaeria bacterium]